MCSSLEAKHLIFPLHKEKKDIAAKLNEVVKSETESITPIEMFKDLCTLEDKYITKHPRSKHKESRNIVILYLFGGSGGDMVHDLLNRIERLNRERVLKM